MPWQFPARKTAYQPIRPITLIVRLFKIPKRACALTPGHPARFLSDCTNFENEWDIERAIEANASTLAFVGVLLGYFVHPYWLALPGLVTAFLFQHAIQGWCPPVPILRRLGFRTANEIEAERQSLKILRGDYEGLSGERSRIPSILAAVHNG